MDLLDAWPGSSYPWKIPPAATGPNGTVAPSSDTDVRLPAVSVTVPVATSSRSRASSRICPCGARRTPPCVISGARSVSRSPYDSGAVVGWPFPSTSIEAYERTRNPGSASGRSRLLPAETLSRFREAT